MNDNERLELIKKVDEQYKKMKLLETDLLLKKDKLSELENNFFVKKYLYLKKEVENIEKSVNLENHKSVYELWLENINSYLNFKNNSDCVHEVCINLEFLNGDYKTYLCLECLKKINIKNIEEFENEHLIIEKGYESIIYNYNDEFKKNLYSMSIEDARYNALKKINYKS